MLYVAMTRGRDNNEAYQRLTGEADHQHAPPVSGAEIHRLRRGNKYQAAHHFRLILANDDRPRSMHAEAERTERHLPPQAIGDLLERNEQRPRGRAALWREHTAARQAWSAAYERMAAAAEASRDTGIDLHAGGLEL